MSADNMAVEIENHRDATRKLLELISEFGKLPNIHIQKSFVFLHTNNKLSKTKIKETILFNTASKTIKYLGINLPQEAKSLYSKNCKTLMRDIEVNTNGKIYCVLGLEKSILLKITILPKAIYRVNAISTKLPWHFSQN